MTLGLTAKSDPGLLDLAAMLDLTIFNIKNSKGNIFIVLQYRPQCKHFMFTMWFTVQ
jgi:hypothetical protein